VPGLKKWEQRNGVSMRPALPARQCAVSALGTEEQILFLHQHPPNGGDDQRRGEAPSVASSGSAALSSSDGELGYFGSWLE
jgi:hypothetical protein